MWTRLAARLRAWWHRREVQATVDEELEFHVEMERAAHQAAGLPAAEASRQARSSFGGAAQIREAVFAVRTSWPRAQFDALRQDLAYALRAGRRTPWFVAGLLTTLALGIGANAAVFSILRAVLLAPLPYRQPDRLAMAWAPSLHSGTLTINDVPPTGDQAFAIHRQPSTTFVDTATYLSWMSNLEPQLDLTVGDQTERLRGAFATANFFDLLGVRAAQGQLFTAADEASNVPLLVLSDALWHRVFGADPALIGQTISVLAGRPRTRQTFTIIGVLPPAFRFTYPQDTEAWAIWPWSAVANGTGQIGYWTVVRLPVGLSAEAAAARIAPMPNPRMPSNISVIQLEPVTDWVVGQTRPALVLLGAVATVLLVITCATVASALFVQLNERERELAMRAALGADRRRLMRQLLTEGAVLATTGAALGTGVAALLTPVLRSLIPPTVPRADQIGVDLWTLGFFAFAAALVTVLATLAPARRGTPVNVLPALNRSGPGASADRSTYRWRAGLVGLESALASALLVTAVLLLVSFWRLNHVPLGFEGERVLTLEMRLIGPQYLARPPAPASASSQEPGPPPALVAFQDELRRGVRALPGVVDAGLSSAVPFRGVDFVFRLNRQGSTVAVVGKGRFVDTGFFTTLEVPLLRGRWFAESDTPTSPRVVIISAGYARQMFGTIDPIGQFIEGNHPLQVVGVVGDMRYERSDLSPMPVIYFPRSQVPNELICLVVRTAPHAANLAPAIRRLVHQLDPDVPAMDATTIDQIVSSSVADRRFYVTSTTAFAGLALVLAMVGLTVVISRSVVERRRELAIRAALGATSANVAALIMRDGIGPALIGTTCGLGAAFAGAAALNRFLFQVAPHAPWAYLGVGGLVVSLAAMAALAPARRAVHISLARVLRAE
jgi:predicted permease